MNGFAPSRAWIIAALLFVWSQGIAAQERPVTNFRVLEQRRLNLGDHAVTLNLVETPLLKPQPPPAPPAAPRAPSAAELARIKEWQSKADVCLFLSVAVYDRQFSVVRWWRDEGEYVIKSSIDFNYLRGILNFETDEARYDVFFGIGNEKRAEMKAWNAEAEANGLPEELQFYIPAPLPKAAVTPGHSSYEMVSAPKAVARAEVIRAFEDLHRYYDENRERLIRAYEESEAARIAQAQWLKEHPPLPKDTTINFFPIRSVYRGQATLEEGK